MAVINPPIELTTTMRLAVPVSTNFRMARWVSSRLERQLSKLPDPQREALCQIFGLELPHRSVPPTERRHPHRGSRTLFKLLGPGQARRCTMSRCTDVSTASLYPETRARESSSLAIDIDDTYFT
ncbi:hypothetical protein [Streptomyces sp. NPDC096311]|uniref:hypothetical protein n=1 Tax=Streptomyces sp. NPDC096311 TaxID=3366083 RepID=UPI0037F4E599